MNRQSIARMKVLALLLFISLQPPRQASAQTICNPKASSLSDNYQINSTGRVDPQYGMASSAIDYTPYCTGSCGNAQLYAVAYTDYTSTPTPTGYVYIKDDGTGSTLSYSFPCDHASADVFIGNNQSTPGDYWVAVAYTIGGNVTLDLYDVAGVGSSLYLNTSVSSNTITFAGTDLNARIDGMTDYQAPYPLSGDPFLVDQFVMVWETTGGSAGINAYAASLSAPTGGITQNIVLSPDVHVPDVASVQQRSMLPPMFQEHAFISYLASGVNLYFADWDVTTGFLTGPTLTANSAPNTFRKARIAAIRDVNTNFPMLGNVDWMIAVDDNTNNVTEYDNLGNAGVTCGISYGGLYPEITAGPGSFYNVGFANNFNQDYEAVQISSLFPAPVVPYYYFIPFQFRTVTNIALCATDNTNNTSYTDYLFGFWLQDFIPMYEKSSSANPPVFKSTGVANITPARQQDIYPNPATDNITLATEGIAGDNATYQVTDMAGRKLFTGNIGNDKQNIDISMLSGGMYLLTICKNGAVSDTKKFSVQ